MDPSAPGPEPGTPAAPAPPSRSGRNAIVALLEEVPAKSFLKFLKISAKRAFRLRIDPAEVLPAERYDVTTAADGARALALIAASDFDVVVSDIRMPGADGLEVLRAARAHDPDVEVVLMTNGDFTCKRDGRVRQAETTTALARLGVEASRD